jgi:hypothetical protein
VLPFPANEKPLLLLETNDMSLTQFWSIKKIKFKRLEASLDQKKSFRYFREEVITALHRAATHPKNRSSPQGERDRERRELPGELRDHFSSSPLDKKAEDEWMTNR